MEVFINLSPIGITETKPKLPTKCKLCKSELKVREYKDCTVYYCTKCSWTCEILKEREVH